MYYVTGIYRNLYTLTMNNIDVNKKHNVRSVVHNPVFNYTTISYCYNQSDNRRYCDFLNTKHTLTHTLSHILT